MPNGRRARALGLLCCLLAAPRGVRADVVPSVFGGKIACAEQSGVQFCEGSVATRIESFDGVPLDVNVTLPPAAMTPPFPLIIDLHGWSLGKSGSPYTAWAQAGYVVLSYTARGFHGSCGNAASRLPDATLANPNVCDERGWIRLADVRYEAHDTQHLAGLLADEGLVLPTKVGVTGASYGGGQSMILAALRNRVMQPDGTLVPWKSPNGLDMTIAAAAPLIPWSDLAYSLTPNGRTLDYRDQNPYGRRGGVQKASWNAALYSIGLATGFYSPQGMDSGSDIQSWNTRVGAGEPYDGEPFLEQILEEITAHHSAYYVDDSIPPAPLFIYNAWTDDLFPVDEALRFQRKTIAKHPGAEIALHLADDFGHSRATLGFTGTAVIDRVTTFFARHLKGVGEAFPPFETFTQACGGATVEGPITAGNWASLHPGEVRYTTDEPQRFVESGGAAATAAATDPLNVALGPCRTVPSDDDPGAATYRLPEVAGGGYTLLGSPTVIADLVASGPNAQVVARLWDVAPGGMQTLVAHTVYRPRTDNRGPQVFQLHPNAWRFAAGHVPKLELLGRSPGYVRPSNGTFTVTVNTLELRLPVHEPPGGAVESPAPVVEPPADEEPLGCGLVPRIDCRGLTAPHGATLAIVANGKRPPRLDWRWKSSGSADPNGFGDPTATTDLRLCVYDATGSVVTSVLLPAAGTCGTRGCWTKTKTGFRYADPGAATSARQGLLIEKRKKRTFLEISARGPHLPVPSMPFMDGPVTVQLVGEPPVCWSTVFTAPRRNTARVLKAILEREQ
jgi:predicted acyl esterase